jgi:hypothetical protein
MLATIDMGGSLTDYACLRARVWSALEERRVLPDEPSYRANTTLAFKLGNAERQRYDWSALGWHHANLTLARPVAEPDLVRMLGFGALLTRFATAPLGPTPRSAELVALGALANFIVAVFDRFVDEQQSARVFPRSVLHGLLRGDDGPADGALAAIAARYLNGLRALHRSGAQDSTVERVHQLIAAMYDAELETVGARPSPTALRRKSALPFVVMGMPAWLALPQLTIDERRWHLRWLYELGDLLGWIDDVVDAEADNAAAHPNRVLIASSREHLPHWLARRCERLLAQWEARVRCIDSGALSGRDVLGTVVISWFGGVATKNGRGS